ncbi:MAG: hypothetical protein RIS79_2588 [Verrucomicrobiota bacterium]|jgi:hypothetical protein
MPIRPLIYWTLCLAFAVFVARAAEPATADWVGAKGLQSKLLPVPEPGRAMLLFAGIMAMSFTYRRAWLNWKSGPQA